MGKLISYPGFPHGMPTTEAATIYADILAFLQSYTILLPVVFRQPPLTHEWLFIEVQKQ